MRDAAGAGDELGGSDSRALRAARCQLHTPAAPSDPLAGANKAEEAMRSARADGIAQEPPIRTVCSQVGCGEPRAAQCSLLGPLL